MIEWTEKEDLRTVQRIAAKTLGIGPPKKKWWRHQNVVVETFQQKEISDSRIDRSIQQSRDEAHLSWSPYRFLSWDYQSVC
jgi:hypothetical protein